MSGSRGFLYPFLFSLYPVFFLYLRNIREVNVYQALWASAGSLGIAIAGWLLTRIFSEPLEKRALVLFLFLLLFHFYGLYYALIRGWLLELSPAAAHALAFTLPGGAWIVLTILVIRSRRSFANLGRVLNFIVLALLSWSLAGIIINQVGSPAGRAGKDQGGPAAAVAMPARAPDIYCFILDEFMAPEAALRLFGHDNRGFSAALRRQGFFVASGSRSRFTLTEPAIADILNLGEFSAQADPSPLVRRNAVAAFLKKRNYRIIEFACLPPLFMAAADQRFYYNLAHVSIFFDDFFRVLFERSLLRILPELWLRRKTDLTRFYRQRVLQVFAELPGVVRAAGAQIRFRPPLLPRTSRSCSTPGAGPATPGISGTIAIPAIYLQQYDFISRRMAETAAMIIRDSPGRRSCSSSPITATAAPSGRETDRGRSPMRTCSTYSTPCTFRAFRCRGSIRRCRRGTISAWSSTPTSAPAIRSCVIPEPPRPGGRRGRTQPAMSLSSETISTLPFSMAHTGQSDSSDIWTAFCRSAARGVRGGQDELEPDAIERGRVLGAARARAFTRKAATVFFMRRSSETTLVALQAARLSSRSSRPV